MNKAVTETLQRVLAKAGTYDGAIDGVRGQGTDAAVSALIEARAAALPEAVAGWSARRRAIACLQLGCHDHAIDAGPIDGLWGPQTASAAEALAETLATGEPPQPWRDWLDRRPTGSPWPVEAQMQAFYGPPGDSRLVRVTVPWPLRLAWERRTKVATISCHQRVAPSLTRVLSRVHAHYGTGGLEALGLDLYGGCFNLRQKRRGTSLSTHAWGAAIDWDPDRNQLSWGRDRARLAGPEYESWWRIWEDEGWVSLGRRRNFDWMHVQAAEV